MTPHTPLKQLWWTEERIQAKVTRAYIGSKLTEDERQFLLRPLAFGEGLTDHTYMDWILDRARRLFLILAEVGVPDQIFGCIDDSWCDADLPVSLINIPSLQLACKNDDTLNKKFYDAQFLYLVRELHQGCHIDYGPHEHIPMEYVNVLPPAVHIQVWDRIHFPARSAQIYMRRRYNLRDKDNGRDHRHKFLDDVHKAQQMVHENIVSVWASYTAGDSAFVLSDFVGEHTLASFIDHRMPTQYQRLRESKRPALLCQWMRCLADALAFIHDHSMAHTAIIPSNILVDQANRIAFSDVGCLRTFQRGKRHNKVEIYDYAAPESRLSSASVLALDPMKPHPSALGRLKKLSIIASSSSSSSSGGTSVRGSSISTMPGTPKILASNERPDSISTMSGLGSPIESPAGSMRNFSRHIYSHHTASKDAEVANEQMSDIFALGCVFLDIISFMVKGKTTDFVKFRSTKVKSSPTSNRTRHDTSFHNAPEKIDAWRIHLRDTSKCCAESTPNLVPDLLELTREMMLPSATLRPTATDIRARLPP